MNIDHLSISSLSFDKGYYLKGEVVVTGGELLDAFVSLGPFPNWN